MLTHSSRLQFIFLGKSRHQKCEVAGHLTSTIKRSEQSTSLYMLSLACPFHSVEEEPAHEMGLPTSVNLAKKILHRQPMGQPDKD